MLSICSLMGVPCQSEYSKLTPLERGIWSGIVSFRAGHFSASEKIPENICFCCGHARDSHLNDKEGWTTLPPNSCVSCFINNPGKLCLGFVEPNKELRESIYNKFQKEIEEYESSNGVIEIWML